MPTAVLIAAALAAYGLTCIAFGIWLGRATERAARRKVGVIDLTRKRRAA